MAFPALALFGLFALLYLAVLGGLYVGQRGILFQPDRARPDAAAVGVPGLTEVVVDTIDGLHLLAWHLPVGPGHPVVLYLHGNGGNLGDRAARVRAFAAAGWGLLMLEYRGYGGNAGTPSEDGLAEDARAALAWLRDTGVRPRCTVLYGESLGTGVAVRAAVGRQLGALILESPYTSIASLARASYPWAPVGLLLRDRFDSAAVMERLRTPTLILQGGRDTIVPPAEGRRLFDLTPEPRQFWLAPEASHFDLWAHGAEPVVLNFAARHLPPFCRR